MRFLMEMFHGYLVFSQQASCYIVAACSVIGIPICICAGIAYYLLQNG